MVTSSDDTPPPTGDARRSMFDISSLRWRLQLWHALILAIVVTALCLLAWRLALHDRRDRIDRELAAFERSFFRIIFDRPQNQTEDAPPPGTDELRERFKELDPASIPLHMRGLFEQSSEGIYIRVWDGDGTILFRSTNGPESVDFPAKTHGVQPERGRYAGHRRELVRGGPRGFRSVVGRDISTDIAALRRLALQITASGFSLWLAGLLGGWWLAGRAIQPISAISRTASRIAGGKVSERIDIADTDNELGRLSNVLNATFDRLENAIGRQRQFTADASHELRTPLTVILSETSRGLKRERDPEGYREILSTCHDAAVRMRSLVESLLLLARQDGEPLAPSRSFDLSSIVADSVRLHQPLADEKRILIRTSFQPALVAGDEQAIAILANNLLSNAVTHQRENGAVLVEVDTAGDHALLRVTDEGPGIAAAHLPRLFDRFYRVDPARGVAHGHSGLGLAIARAIAKNHHGSITVTSVEGQGTTFTVTFPIAA